MNVPFLNLKIQYESIQNEIQNAITQVIEKTAFAGGPFVAQFEEDFARFCGCRHAIGVGSGTDALWLSLTALGIGAGDEVITVPDTFIATAEAISFCGAKPVFVDVAPDTYNMDPCRLEAAITPDTKAIIPVHLFGQMADMDPIIAIADKHGLPVLEDSAQAHGARYKGRRTGSIGAMAAFSFYPGKNLGAYGEGGAVTTDDPDLDHKVRMLRDHGSDKKYYHDMLGYNARMEGIPGAVLGVKLKHLDDWNAERNRVARKYDELLKGLPLTRPNSDPNYEQVYHLYMIETERRDELQKYLGEHKIPTIIHYPVPIHFQKAFDHLGYRGGDSPITEKLVGEILSLPIYPEMTDDMVGCVAERIKSFFG